MSKIWPFKVYSMEYGDETYSGYDTKADALRGIKAIKINAKDLNDGVIRYYTDPFEYNPEDD